MFRVPARGGRGISIGVTQEPSVPSQYERPRSISFCSCHDRNRTLISGGRIDPENLR